MKKLIAIVLTLALMMTAVSALADIVIVQNKVEITSQMEGGRLGRRFRFFLSRTFVFENSLKKRK